MLKFDLSKAFDRVNRSLLWEKLEKKGVHPQLIQAIKSTYDTSTRGSSRIKVGKEFSEFFSLPNGVKQGSVLSPILFVIYVSDLTEDLGRPQEADGHSPPTWADQYSSLMFIDDLILLANSYPQLERMVEVLNNFLVQHSAVANESKTKLFTNRKIDQEDRAWAERNKVSLAKHNATEYLGMIIENRNEHETERVIKKMKKKFFILKNSGLRWSRIDAVLGVEMIQKIIVPIIESEAAVRTLTDNQHLKIDRTLAKFYKEIFGSPWHAPTRWTLWEAGQINSSWIHKRAKLRYWRRVTKTQSLDRLGKIVREKHSQTREEIKVILRECELDVFIKTRLLPQKNVWKRIIGRAVMEAHAEEEKNNLGVVMGVGWVESLKPFPWMDKECLQNLKNPKHRSVLMSIRARSNGLRDDIHSTLGKTTSCRLCEQIGTHESIQHLMLECPQTMGERTNLVRTVRNGVKKRFFKAWKQGDLDKSFLWLVEKCYNAKKGGDDISKSFILTYSEIKERLSILDGAVKAILDKN
jgi:hypothetical protein